jgi:protein O-GlcNAc transferase
MGESKRRKAAGLPDHTGAAGAVVGRLVIDGHRFLGENRLHDAKAAFEQAIKADPARVDAWQGMGMVALAGGAPEAAARIFTRALQLMPDDVEARIQLAKALKAAGQMEASRSQWLDVTRRSPEDARCWACLGIAEQEAGNTADAALAFQRAFALQPSLDLRAKLATLVSPIVPSREAIDAERQRMDESLDALLAGDLQQPILDDAMSAATWTNFFLAYHGRLDRDLQVKTSRMYRRIVPSLSYVAGHCNRPPQLNRPLRIGLISRFFHNDSIGRVSLGLFAQLAKDRFSVTAIFIAPVIDDVYSRFIRKLAARSLIVPQDLAVARKLIEAEELDVLFYQDIGMELFSYFLAHSRLAPIQCVSWGHPDTTGISTIDYFVSNDLYEVPAAESHYSEQLYLLHDLGSLAYYYRPTLPETLKTRADFGFGDTERLYICPQNLFKIHPDMDDLIAEILRRDACGRIVMFTGRTGNWTNLIKRRWAASLPDVIDRILFLPRMTNKDYLNLVALADVVLDTVHFNGGNTSLDAFAVGTPVVTWPGEFLRGRQTQGMYRKMGMMDCVVDNAKSYVETAVRIASNAGYRMDIKKRIDESSSCLFEDMEVIREFERFFLDVAGRLAD